MNQKKTTALLLGLTMSLTGTAFAAPTNQAQDLDSRIAALEQQQDNLEKELKELRHQNSQLKNQTRSQKKQLSGLSKSVKNELDRVQISGFGRVSWDNDNIKGYTDRNDNRRFYLDLKGKFKVNDDWNFNFESETNPRYAKYVDAGGNYKSHNGHDDEDGTIQRVWAEGKVGQVNFDIGRRWRGLGFQNVLLGNETDGAVLSTPIPGSKLSASLFHLSPTDKGYDFNVTGVGIQGQVNSKLQINAAIAKLNIGNHDAMGTNYYSPETTVTIKDGTFKAGYAGANNVVSYGGATGNATTGFTQMGAEGNPMEMEWTKQEVQKDSDPSWNQHHLSSNYAHTNQMTVKNIKFDGQGTYSYIGTQDGSFNASGATLTGTQEVTVGYPSIPNTAGRYGFVLSAMWNPMKNIFLIGDYARTNGQDYTVGEWGANGYTETKYDKHDCTALRLNYRWSNINDPGSFQLYARWYNYAKNINNLVGIFGDKEWGALQPGSKGWIFGFKYVPAKNIEWETFYEYATAQNTLYGHKNETYHRNFLRTMVDYHF